MLKSDKKIIFIDGLGGLFASLMFGLVLPIFKNDFPLPDKILYTLSFTAFFYFVYSMTCYFFLNKNLVLWLKILIAINSLFCFLTIFLLINFYFQLSVIGIIYFIFDTLIILTLVFFELKLLNREVKSKAIT